MTHGLDLDVMVTVLLTHLCFPLLQETVQKQPSARPTDFIPQGWQLCDLSIGHVCTPGLAAPRVCQTSVKAQQQSLTCHRVLLLWGSLRVTLAISGMSLVGKRSSGGPLHAVPETQSVWKMLMSHKGLDQGES